MRCTHLWWLLWLQTAAQLQLQVDGPAAYDHSPFVVKGDAIRITVQNTNATDVCIFIDDTRHCSTDRVIDVSGLAPGTRVIAASAGNEKAEVVFDVLPAEELTTRPLPAQHVAEPLDLPLVPLKRRLNYCALTNSLERHSQNLIFLRTAALLDRKRWLASIFVPATAQGDLHDDFRRAFIPVHYVDLNNIDYQELRKQAPDSLDPSTASLLSKCDVHVQPEDLLLKKPKEPRHGVAYLYYRCRPHRERFVELLKREGVQVDALGRCSSNSEDDFVPRRFSERWHDDAIEQYASYKFVVAFENDDVPGYVTEKLGLAFLAGAVPIYWGPSTEHIFNPDSYVRCDDLEACARRVKRLDGDDVLYERMRNTPKVNDLSVLQASNLSNDLIARLQPKFVLRYPRRD